MRSLEWLTQNGTKGLIRTLRWQEAMLHLKYYTNKPGNVSVFFFARNDKVFFVHKYIPFLAQNPASFFYSKKSLFPLKFLGVKFLLKITLAMSWFPMRIRRENVNDTGKGRYDDEHEYYQRQSRVSEIEKSKRKWNDTTLFEYESHKMIDIPFTYE